MARRSANDDDLLMEDELTAAFLGEEELGAVEMYHKYKKKNGMKKKLFLDSWL